MTGGLGKGHPGLPFTAAEAILEHLARCGWDVVRRPEVGSRCPTTPGGPANLATAKGAASRAAARAAAAGRQSDTRTVFGRLLGRG